MGVGVAEQASSPRIFYVEPTRRKSDYRSHEFPALLAVSSDVLLAAKTGTRTSIFASYINYLTIESTDYGIVNPILKY